MEKRVKCIIFGKFPVVVRLIAPFNLFASVCSKFVLGNNKAEILREKGKLICEELE